MIPDLPWPIEYSFIVLLGLCFGSFATVLVHRIPREIPLGLFSHSRSACPHCQKKITWKHNIPLFSYLVQKGRCAECGAKISHRYPLIETLTAIGFVATYYVQTRVREQPLENFARWAELAIVLYYTLSLIVIVFVDLDFRIIPDRFSLGNWGVAALASLLLSSPPWPAALAGAVFGFGSFFLMAWGYEKWKGIEGLGFGDVKMMGWLGTWLGIAGVPFVILSASLTGLAVGLLAMRSSKEGLQTAIPFGPFLAAGAYAAWMLQSFGVLGF